MNLEIVTPRARALHDAKTLAMGMDGRQVGILTKRLAAAPALTLDELGTEFGVTRERIRQLEQQLLKTLRTWDASEMLTDVHSGKSMWLHHIDQLSKVAPDWFLPLTPDVTIFALLRALGAIDVTDGVWVSRGMLRAPAADVEPAWDHLVNIGKAGRAGKQMFYRQLQRLGLATEYIDAWMNSQDLYVRHGIVRSRSEYLADFLLNEMHACGHPVSLERIGEWVDGRWSAASAQNLVQGDPRFSRCDLKAYGLTEWHLREYTSIREEIEKLIAEQGPMSVAEITETLTAWFEIAPGSVAAYCHQPPFALEGGLVRLATVSSHAAKLAPALQDLKQDRQWRNVFFTRTGMAYRFEVNAEHLRGSGTATAQSLAAITGVAEGELWELPLANCAGSVKVTRSKNSQPAIGSVKTALMALEAQLGDIAMIWFDGNPGEIKRVRMTVTSSAEMSQDPIERALLLSACDLNADDPIAAIALAMGSTATAATDLADLAERRKDDALAAALREVAAI